MRIFGTDHSIDIGVDCIGVRSGDIVNGFPTLGDTGLVITKAASGACQLRTFQTTCHGTVSADIPVQYNLIPN